MGGSSCANCDISIGLDDREDGCESSFQFFGWRSGFRVLRRIFGAEVHMICEVCQRREAQGFVCGVCLARMSKWLQEIPALYLELHTRHQEDPVPSMKVGSSGPVGGVRVSGSRERSVPIDLDAVDLLLNVEYSMPNSEMGMQMVPVLGLLWAWVSLFAWQWYRDECLPVREVPVLALWLTQRLDDLALVDQATPELEAALRRCVGQLRRVVDGRVAKPEFRYGRCAKCKMRALYFDPEYEFVRCATCGHTMTEDDYAKYLQETVRLKPKDLGIHAQTQPDPELSTPI